MPGENEENQVTTGGEKTAVQGDQQQAAGSTTTTTGDEQQQQQQQQQVAEQTPTAPKSSLEAVKQVMEKDRAAAVTDVAATAAAAATAATAAKAGAPTDEAAALAEAGEGDKNWLTPAEWGKLDQRVRARITGLVKQRNTIKDEFHSFRSAAEPKARTFDDLHKFTRAIGVNGQQLGGYFELIRQIHQDPAKAWETIQPTLRYLQEHVGAVLPEDLQVAVDDGKITKEYATQLAGTRKEKARLERDTLHRQQSDVTESNRVRFEGAVNDTTATISAWEQSWKGSDPDYAKKKDRVWERMTVLLNDARAAAGNVPLLPKEKVIQIANQAKKDVEEWLATLMPARKEQRVVTGGNQNVQANKLPTTSLEAAKIGLSLTATA